MKLIYFVLFICIGFLGCVGNSMHKPFLYGNENIPKKLHGKNFHFLGQLVSATHPRLKSAKMDVLAALGRFSQSGLWTNPRLEMEAESIGGHDGGVHGAELGFTISQEIPINGALGLAQRMAEKDISVKKIHYHLQKRLLLSEVYIAFQRVLLARRRVKEIQKLLKNISSSLEKLKKMLEVGKRPQIDFLELKIVHTETSSRLQKAQMAQRIAQRKFRSFLPRSSVFYAKESLYRRVKLPTFSVIEKRIDKHPENQKIILEREKVELKKRAYEAQRILNPEISIGGKRGYGDNENTLMIGVGFELPIFQRNQGNIREANALLQKLQEDQKNLKKELENQVFEAHQKYELAQNTLALYQKKILPASKQSFDFAKVAYARGKISIFILNRARKSLMENHLNHLQKLENLHEALAKLYRLGVIDFSEFIGEER